MLTWSEPLAVPRVAAADRTTTLSPTFSPLTTCVVASPTTPVCTRSVVWVPSAASTVTVEPLSACEGTAMPVTCEVTMSAVALMPALRLLAVWSRLSVTG